MPYIVVNREAVLSRASPDAVLTWIDLGVSRATDYRYAITFETEAGARMCARMQGGSAHRIGDWDDSQVAVVGGVDDTAYRVAHNWGLDGVEQTSMRKEGTVSDEDTK